MWNFPLFPERASTNADKVDLLFLGELAVVLFFTFFICFLILFLAIRYRRGSRVDRKDPPRTNLVIEAVWIGVPLSIAMLMFLGGAIVFFDLYGPPADASRVDVVGKQWMWKIQHPEGKREINELHVPVGRPIVLRMISEDVIHSFFIPDFRIKQDVLPGRYTSLWFQATKPGRYHLFCAEYCGTEHSKMVGWVEVMEPSDYERWLTEGQQDAPSMARQGRELFVQHHCAGCHGDSATVKAPRLEGIYGRPVPIMQGEGRPPRFVIADDRYIRDSILLPASQVVAGYAPIMPSFAGEVDGKKRMPEDDLLKIIEYIRSIGPKTTEETGP